MGAEGARGVDVSLIIIVGKDMSFVSVCAQRRLMPVWEGVACSMYIQRVSGLRWRSGSVMFFILGITGLLNSVMLLFRC